MSSGGKATLDACRALNKPFLLVFQGVTRPSQVVAWLSDKGVRVLNVAGNRESKSPGIGERVERFMGEVLR
jgi:Circularly permutated YpsA SLOG family